MNSYKLGDIIDIKHGYAFSGNYISKDDNGVVLITPGNFKIGGGFQEDNCKYYSGDIPSEYILSPGSIIVTMTDLSKDIDTLGYSAIVPNSPGRIYLHNQRIGLISFKNGLCDPYFIYYLLQTREYQREIANTSTGAVIHHSSPSKICSYKFLAPDKDVQERIGKILMAYEKLIENNQKQIKLLEEAAQRLYKEWFVDYHFPGHELVKVVDGIPDNWEIVKINNLLLKIHDSKHMETRLYRKKGKYPIVDQGSNFVAGYTDDISYVFNSELPVIIFGDHTRILKFIYPPFVSGADGTKILVSNNKRMPQHLFYQSLKHINLSNYHYARHFKYLKAESILLPSQDIADIFENICIPISKKIQNIRGVIAELKEARDRLLPKLMSGEIEVTS